MTVQKHYYDRSLFLRDIDFLHGYLKDEKFDAILGLSRGGLVPSVYLSHKLNLPLIPVQWSTRDHGKKILPNLVDGHRYLIVDDICDSGETLESLYDVLLREYSCEYVDAVLWQNTSAPFQCDYYAREIDRNTDDRWIVFDWEV
jgi:uncharacterized protein